MGMQDGWQELSAAADIDQPLRLLDPALVMSSRDLEPLVWPKVWHFTKKLRALYGEIGLNEGNGDNVEGHRAASQVFGPTPVTWVPLARRWMSGNRHRVMAARLAGMPFTAVPSSKSADPWAPSFNN